MNVVTLHVLRTRQSADFGLLRIAAPALEPDARVVVLEGLPPEPIAASAHVAPMVLQGDVDGHRVYAEQISPGLCLDQLAVPASLAAWIGAGVLQALSDLRAAGVVHGRVTLDRIYAGTQGQVVLFGRGRVGGTPDHDRAGAEEVLAGLGLTVDGQADLDDMLTHLRTAADPSDGQALGTLVRRFRKPGTIIDQIHMQVGPTPDSLDEVQPDLGPDGGHGTGLLDRWAVTTHHGGDESTAELTGSVAQSSSPLALTFWTALAAPAEHVPPPDRFAEVEGEPSRGLRALLVEEPPDTLPGLVGGEVPPFLMSLGDDTSPGETAQVEVEVTPIDDDGDTAIYDLRERELASAIRKADDKTRIADLEAQVSDAERRVNEAERRARAAEEEARVMATARPSPPTPPRAPTGLGAFLRVEVFVVVAIALLMAFLVWRAFG